MNSLIEKNKAFTRAILSGKADRHGFICHPPIPQMFDDYTVSDKPVKEWVPFVVENYRRRVESLETLHDDSVRKHLVAKCTLSRTVSHALCRWSTARMRLTNLKCRISGKQNACNGYLNLDNWF
jgi:hypothetical protein